MDNCELMQLIIDIIKENVEIHFDIYNGEADLVNVEEAAAQILELINN